MISIKDYLKETDFASGKIIEAIWEDVKNANMLQKEIERESKIVQKEHDAALSLQLFSEDPDDIMLGVGRYWENHFGPALDLYHKNDQLQRLTQLLSSREISLTTLSSDLLQHAKKGISLIYGNPKKWPTGRLIGSQGLSKVILEARNQSVHVEEAVKNGKFPNLEIKQCFETLASEIDPVFSDYLKRDLAFDIIKALGWTDIGKYHADILGIQ